MADPEQPMPELHETGSSEIDPYSPEGAFGRWVKDVTPESPQFEALSDLALREELEYQVTEPEHFPEALSALGALRVQEHNNRRLPGYVQAQNDLSTMVITTLNDHHEAQLKKHGVAPNQLEAQRHLQVGGHLTQAVDNIVAQKATPPQSSPTA